MFAKMPSSRLPLLLVASLLLFAGGCGTVRYVYSQLDWIVPWYVRDYVRLSSEQRVLLDERLAERLAWHCASELPDYASFLRDVRADINASRLDALRMTLHADRIEQLVRRLTENLAPDLAGLLTQLDDAQVEELAGNLDERNRDTRRKFLEGSAEQLHEQRVERMEKRLRRWLGRLNADQQALIQAWSRALEPSAETWFDNRLAWQARLLDVLAVRSDRSRFDPAIATLVMAPDAHWSDAYREQVTRNRALTMTLLADVLAVSTDAQRSRFGAEIDNLVGQFDRLACAAPASVAAGDQAKVLMLAASLGPGAKMPE